MRKGKGRSVDTGQNLPFPPVKNRILSIRVSQYQFSDFRKTSFWKLDYWILRFRSLGSFLPQLLIGGIAAVSPASIALNTSPR